MSSLLSFVLQASFTSVSSTLIVFYVIMISVMCFLQGWSWHEGGVGTVESKAWRELLYGWAWRDTQSRHFGPRCSSCELLRAESVDKSRGRWAGSLYPSVCWSHLHLVLWGILSDVFIHCSLTVKSKGKFVPDFGPSSGIRPFTPGKSGEIQPTFCPYFSTGAVSLHIRLFTAKINKLLLACLHLSDLVV